jgi:UDP-glucose 4-epimerase
VTYKIGITGGSGYVGYSLAKYLSNNFEIKILDVKSPQKVESKITYVFCDIRDSEDVKKNLEDVDLVIHTAIVQIPLINDQKRLGYEVNIVGTQNICEAVNEKSCTKGMIITGSWHTIGERELKGIIDEEFGFRPDKVEERARLYALSKIAQESIVRFYDEMSDKIFGIIRMGTVLGEGMPEKTAANIFIERGLKGETITPYKHSMFRPMLYVDISDVCKAFERFSLKILNGEIKKESDSLAHIVNVYYPEPITILELAEIVQKAIIKHTNGTVSPKIEIVDTGQKTLFNEDDKKQIKVDIAKAVNLLGINQLRSPQESIEEIIKNRIKRTPRES